MTTETTTSAADDALTVFTLEREIMETKCVSRDPIPFSKLEWGNNIRSESCLLLDKMIRSLKDRTYLDRYPITVSKHGAKFLVLCGNRRTLALKKIQEVEPEIFKAVLPGGKIPAIVLEGLTVTEEALIRNDHSDDEDRVGLDEESIFYAVKQLVDVGITGRRDIATKLGLFIPDKVTKNPVPNGSYVQQRSNLARLPQEVQDEFIKMMRDKSSSNVRWGMVPTLFKKFMAGFATGKFDGGEAFKEYWEQCKKPKDKSDDDTGVKALSRNEISKAAEKLGSTYGRLICLRIAGNPVQDDSGKIMSLEDIDAKITQAEAAMDTLTDIRNHLTAKKFDEMMSKIIKAKK